MHGLLEHTTAWQHAQVCVMIRRYIQSSSFPHFELAAAVATCKAGRLVKCHAMPLEVLKPATHRSAGLLSHRNTFTPPKVFQNV
jgi:hypothetical protein